jgi:hypothetical protein
LSHPVLSLFKWTNPLSKGGGVTPIPTNYGGYRFRSRLEARWAVFYDTAGIRWRYETEGYVTGAGPYLPDFYIPHLDCFIEIKGECPTLQEQHKSDALCLALHKPVYLFFGQIPRMIDAHGPCMEVDRDDPDLPSTHSAWAWFYDRGGVVFDTNYNWCQCPHCELLGIGHEADARGLRCCDAPRKAILTGDAPVLVQAYQTARRKQFEYVSDGPRPAA